MSRRFSRRNNNVAAGLSDPDIIASALYEQGLEQTRLTNLREGLTDPKEFLRKKNQWIVGNAQGVAPNGKDAITPLTKKYFVELFKYVKDMTGDNMESRRCAQALADHIEKVLTAELDKAFPSATAGKIEIRTPILKQ